MLCVIYLAASAVIALGYGVFYFELPLPNGSVGQLLDRMDYISNSVMMFVLFLQSTGILSQIDDITGGARCIVRFSRKFGSFFFCTETIHAIL